MRSKPARVTGGSRRSAASSCATSCRSSWRQRARCSRGDRSPSSTSSSTAPRAQGGPRRQQRQVRGGHGQGRHRVGGACSASQRDWKVPATCRPACAVSVCLPSTYHTIAHKARRTGNGSLATRVETHEHSALLRRTSRPRTARRAMARPPGAVQCRRSPDRTRPRERTRASSGGSRRRGSLGDRRPSRRAARALAVRAPAATRLGSSS